MDDYLENFKNCLQKEIPYCAGECPFNFDILEFIRKMKKGRFEAAYRLYCNAVGFPGIVAEICPQPCKAVCPRKDVDQGIELGMLEKACVDSADNIEPVEYNLPAKKHRIAIVGAGISGLACALRLCLKKYEVDVYESSGRIGGQYWELLPEKIFMQDIERQFMHTKYTLFLNCRICDRQELLGKGYAAVFVATGQGGDDLGLLGARGIDETAPVVKLDSLTWFLGGGLLGQAPIDALAEGLTMGTTIDNYIKAGVLPSSFRAKQTAICLDRVKLEYIAPVAPSMEGRFSQDEARLEASRCIECQCDFCRTYCDLTTFYNKWPLRIRDEIAATILPGTSEVKATPAKRLLSTCNQCGLCRKTCPQEIDLERLILEGRKSMHRQEKVPWAFYDFWIKDMHFANGPSAALFKNSATEQAEGAVQEGEGGIAYAFFPGCQLGASNPDLVEQIYAQLLTKHSDTGIILRCCAAPAEWSGDEALLQQELTEIRRQWESMGKPILIMACPTCIKKFQHFLPEVLITSLYEVLLEWHCLPQHQVELNLEMKAAVFDPCAAIQRPQMRQAVRELALSAGFVLDPLPGNDAWPHCCGFGGQPAIANPAFAEYVATKRIQESEAMYITYCSNCQDVFRDAGKRTLHILDIMVGNYSSDATLPTVTQRRENRRYLKKLLLKKYWGEDMEVEKSAITINLQIPLELKEKISHLKILEEDILQVVDFCQRTKRRVFNTVTGIFSGYQEVGYMTYWVEYKELAGSDVVELVNVYAHRIKIDLEAVWNGSKTEADV